MARRELPNEFIIQNFRSWQGKNYISLNCINFLFGANSSGKSSVIAAMSLLKQSARSQTRGIIPQKLIANGESINLGDLDRQMNRNSITDSNGLDTPKMGFGIRYRKPDWIKTLLGENYSSELPKAYFRFFEDMEFFITFSNGGQIESVALYARNIKILEICALNDTKKPSFMINYTTDERFWKTYYDTFISKLNVRYLMNSDDQTKSSLILGLKSALKLEYRKFERNLRRYRGLQARLDGFIKQQKELELQIAKDATENTVSKAEYDALQRLRKASKNVGKDIPSKPSINSKLQDQQRKSTKHYFLKVNDRNERIFASLKHRITSTQLEIAEICNLSGYDFRECDDLQDVFEIFANQVQKAVKQPILSKILKYNSFESFYEDVTKSHKYVIDHKSSFFDYYHRGADINLATVLADLPYFQQTTRPEQFSGSAEHAIELISALSLRSDTLLDTLSKGVNFVFMKFSECNQIGPFREQPPRIGIIDPDKSVKNVGKSGENVLNILRKATGKELRDLNDWLKKLEIGYQIEKRFHKKFNVLELNLIDDYGNSVSINDVGYGISQVLPVILQCSLLQNSFITIEQPELHIHPRLQANLADLFIWSASSLGNMFQIETHSEHMILRLQRRQKEEVSLVANKASEWENITNSIDISIIEKEDISARSIVSKLQINSQGGFTGNWPGGFFEERFEELGFK